MNVPPLPWESAPVILGAVYALGVCVGLLAIDAPPMSRLGLAILWPIGPLAFIVTVSTLLLASLIAFPVWGAAVLALALALAAFASPAQGVQPAPPPLEARFIGNMAFAISDGETTVFTDFPYQSGYSVYMEYNAREIRSATPRALSLITHRHGDHWDRALFDRAGWSVVAPLDALEDVPAARVVRALPIKPMAARVSFGAIGIEAIPTPHGGLGHYSYLVSWHGRRLYFTGDTDSTDQLLAAKNLDVAFVSPWLFERVTRAGRRIDARRIVIYHQTADQGLPECRENCLVPTQGQTLRF